MARKKQQVDSTSLLGKVPPQSKDAEQAVLGAMLLDHGAVARVLEILNSEDYFYHEAHKKVFSAILDLFHKSQPADIVTVSEELRRNNELEAAGGASYVAQLPDGVPTTANVEHYANIVKEKGLIRSLILAANEVIARAYDEEAEADHLLDEAEQLIFGIAERKIARGFVSTKDLAYEGFERIEELRKEKKRITGLPTGFTDLDTMLSGLQRSDLVIVAGRPSMGKTSLALNIAQHVAIREKHSSAIFSLEMSKEQLIQRLFASEGKVNLRRLQTGYFDLREFAQVRSAADRIREAPIYIDDSASTTPLEVRAQSRRLKAQGQLDLVVVDYMQLMQTRRRYDNRVQEISEISRSLKALARELEVPVVALSQLSRAVEAREDNRPRLSDLRESGAIEQDADVVLMLYREEYYRRRTGEEEIRRLEEIRGMMDEEASSPRRPGEGSEVEIIVAKQRNGPTGTVDLVFFDEETRFANPVLRHEEVPF